MTDSVSLVNPETLLRLYGEIPPLENFRFRSMNLDWQGPKVTLRVDLLTFPQIVPPEWHGTDVDTVQCHLQFLAVADFSLTRWDPSVKSAWLTTKRLDAERRLQVQVKGAGLNLEFTSSESVLVGHVSAFKMGKEGTDEGRHLFSSKLDQMRHNHIPATDEKTFYARL
ncbi:Imm50 family immunity protein [Streptomyces sp. NPDC058745]|uniref:Imm50 family immunity protein n=1 Tax=Streptomyces sp. NPDC058745 TaxID=3346621 RepID=UPI0036BC2CD7